MFYDHLLSTVVLPSAQSLCFINTVEFAYPRNNMFAHIYVTLDDLLYLPTICGKKLPFHLLELVPRYWLYNFVIVKKDVIAQDVLVKFSLFPLYNN